MSVLFSRLVHHPIRWCLSICFTLMITQLSAHADQLTVQLKEVDAKAEYQRLFLRAEGQSYNYTQWVYQGTNPKVTIDNLDTGVLYHMVARSYAPSKQSTNSNEVSFILPEDKNAPPAIVWIEAEDGTVSSPMQLMNDNPDCSGAYVITPNGGGNDWSGDGSSGSVAYQFELPSSGKYTIWGRVFTPEKSGDSFWVSMDGRAPILWDTQVSSNWVWDKVSGRSAGDPAVFLLTAGSHTLVVKNREDGAAMDKILITNSPDYIPEDLGGPLEIPDSDGDGIDDLDEVDLYGTDPGNKDTDGDGIEDGQELHFWAEAWNADHDGDGIINILDADSDNDGVTDGDELFEGTDPKVPNVPEPPIPSPGEDRVNIWMEAEDADITSPMQMANGTPDCSGDYVISPNGSGNNYSANATGGSIEFQFEAPVDGAYTLWSRIIAPTGGDDSYWVSVDGQTPMLWDAQRSTAWTWDTVGDRNEGTAAVINLTAGDHTLVFMTREDGAALDRVLLTNDPDYLPEGLGDQLLDPVNIWMEAETADIEAPMQIDDGILSCSGDYVIAPNGSGSDYTGDMAAGSVTFHFEIPVTGRYTVWSRVLAQSKSDDSFWVSMDGTTPVLWDTQRSTGWIWDKIGDRNTGQAVSYRLAAGSHTLTFKTREDGTAIDKILITNNTEYLPEGLGQQGEVSKHLLLEAESGYLFDPMQIQNSIQGNSGGYVITPNGSGNNFDANTPAGSIELQFDIPVAGAYTLWARAHAPSGGDDSFWVSVDGCAPLLWDTQQSTGWTWDTVSDRSMASPAVFELTAGSHTLIFKTREDGAAIDQVLITLDPDFVPE